MNEYLWHKSRLNQKSWHYVMLVCTNGHIITNMLKSHPEDLVNKCTDCGAQTIFKCLNCNVDIRGLKHIYGTIVHGRQSPASYCHECGEPYPWTNAAIDAANELADEMDELSDQDKEMLKGSIPDLLVDTPNTKVAEMRFKKIMKKVGKEGCEAIKGILYGIISEGVKLSLFGG